MMTQVLRDEGPFRAAEVQASIFVADVFGNYPSEAVGTLVSRLPEELQPIIRAVVVTLSRWMT